MSQSNGTWMIRAGRNAAYLDSFLDGGFVAMGISEMLGEECLDASRKELSSLAAKAHPKWTKSVVASRAGQLSRFLSEVAVGDTVVTYDPNQRRYVLGQVAAEPRYAKGQIPELPFRRAVNWTHRVARDGLTLGTRNSLGAIQTIFRLSTKVASELAESAVLLGSPEDETKPNKPKEPSSKEPSLEDLRHEVVAKAEEFIEDLIASLDPYEMQDLVAGMLRAMGYKTRVSPKGADRGVDIFASPDGLGLQEPRIFVEVKHRPKSSMGSQAVRAFMGGRQLGDRCLYVSTGGFTREARYEAERSSVPLTLIGLPDLRRLVTEHYESLDPETRTLVPLARIYWPISEA